MFEQQHFVDLQQNGSFGDAKSWLSGEDQPSSPSNQQSHSSLPNASGSNGNVDRLLYKNLVEMVPLVESLMDQRVKPSFTRRASLIYTKTPSRESYPKKMTESKGRRVAQSIPTKKRRDMADKEPGKTSKDNQDSCADDFSIFSSRALTVEKDREELILLQAQVEDLQQKLLEKDELLKSAETLKDQMAAVFAKLDELKRQVAEKDSLLKSANLQLSDAKIKLADKRAALEKLQWEAMMSNKKVEKLQEELNSMQGEISSFMLLFEGLAKNDSPVCGEDYDVAPYYMDQIPQIDDTDEMQIKMEEAREAYIEALAVARENQDEESLAIATNARLHLQSFVIRTKNVSVDNGFPSHGIFGSSGKVPAH